jgi:hypothetical protein
MEQLLFHAKLYGYGEKYLVAGLKTSASAKFRSVFPFGMVDEVLGLARVIEEVYSSTPRSDRKLRDLIVKRCSNKMPELLETEEFQNALSIREFSLDLLKSQALKFSALKARADKAIETASLYKRRRNAATARNGPAIARGMRD